MIFLNVLFYFPWSVKCQYYISFRELWKGLFIFRETWSIPPITHSTSRRTETTFAILCGSCARTGCTDLVKAPNYEYNLFCLRSCLKALSSFSWVNLSPDVPKVICGFSFWTWSVWSRIINPDLDHPKGIRPIGLVLSEWTCRKKKKGVFAFTPAQYHGRQMPAK